MVWGGIFHNQKTDLVFIDETLNAQRYKDQVINAAVVPLFAAQPQLTLMHDGATPHTARAVGQHLANLGIAVLPWTSKSPDLNPIEHIWDELERRLRTRQHEPATLAELKYPRRRMGGHTPGASAVAHRVNAGAVWRRRGC